MNNFLQYILHGKSYIHNDKNLNLQLFSQALNSEFDKNNQFVIPAQPRDQGKLGGKNIVLDASTNVGIFMVEEDRLGVSSQANFSTVRSNCCVFKGKWVYEVMLNTKGVMQIGWSTKNCQFSHEQGVGDTPDSYAYDGNRIRKWNLSTAKYGEAWRIGDTITCAIDLDVGNVSFYRNGKSLGIAFRDIKTGYGIAYFPTISLSIYESVRLNFGATPLLHPIEDYKPLQEAPMEDLVKARILFSGLERVIDLFVRLDLAQVSGYVTDKEDSKNSLSNNPPPAYYQSISPYPLEDTIKFSQSNQDILDTQSNNITSKLNSSYYDVRMDIDPDSPSSPDRSPVNLNVKKPKIHNSKLITVNRPQNVNSSQIILSSLPKPDFDISRIPNFERYITNPETTSLTSTTSIPPYNENNMTIDINKEMDKTSQSSITTNHLDVPQISPHALLFIVAGYYFDRLNKVLSNPYVVETCFFKVFHKHVFVVNHNIADTHFTYHVEFINKFLDLFWAFTDDSQVKGIMDSLITSIVTHYRFSPLNTDFNNQKIYLSYMKSLLAHEPTRKYLLQNILFEKTKLPLLLHLKSPDFSLLEILVPQPYLNIPSIYHPLTYQDPLIDESTTDDFTPTSSTSIEDSNQQALTLTLKQRQSQTNLDVTTPDRDVTYDIFSNIDAKFQYDNSMSNLNGLVSDIDTLQQDIVKYLLNNRDTLKGVSSRYLFLKKFRNDFIRQNINFNIIHHPFNKCPLPAILCTFQHLCQYLRKEWDKYNEKYPHRSVPSSQAFVPTQYFYNDSINYFDLQRLAGLMSYLRKTYDRELNEALNDTSSSPTSFAAASTTPLINIPLPSTSSNYSSSSTSSIQFQPSTQSDPSHEQPINLPTPSSSLDVNPYPSVNSIPCSSMLTSTTFSVNPKIKSEASSSSLIELLDGIILLYHISGHKHTSKMAKVRDILKEYLSTIKNLQQKLDICPAENIAVKNVLTKTKEIFVHNAFEQARLLAWIRTMVFSKDKQDNVAWLLRVVMTTIDKAYKKGGNFHLFIPEFYLETCLNAFSDLKNNFHPTAPLTDIKDFRCLLNSYVFLVVRCFIGDSTKIVNSELRDRLTQSLADLVCYSASLKVLETELSNEERRKFVEVLLRPYENRPWAQTNWILVRFWKGSGFGFRYSTIPICTFEAVQPFQPATTINNNTGTLPSTSQLVEPMNLSFLASVTGLSSSNNNTTNPIGQATSSQLTNQNHSNIETVNANLTTTSMAPSINQDVLTSTSSSLVRPTPIIFTPMSPLNNISTPSPPVEYIKPIPSLVFQKHIGEVLSKDPDKASTTVNSILNQLNWAFSEFVGMLQEVEQAASRSDVQVYIDGRQLKLCATCFDLTVGLLRTLEMLAFTCHEIFTGFNDRPAAEILLANIFQLTCQILARVTTKKSAFNLVVSLSMPGLEMVKHYPILSAVAGILVHLILKLDHVSQARTTKTLLNEAGFQLANLQTLVGIEKPVILLNEQSIPPQETILKTPLDERVSKLLNLKNYGGALTEDEIRDLDSLINWLEQEQAKNISARVSISEDDLCPICYARPLEVRFHPCGHRSCRSCITHYLMNKRECFFCKSNVGIIEDIVKTNVEDIS